MKTDILNKRVLVGLISHNRLNFTLRALETLQNTQLPFDLLIVDNGSTNDTKQILSNKALEYGAKFISIENRNCNGARDVINHYGLYYDYVIYVDNDAIMPNHWLEQLLEHAISTDAALLGVSQSDFGGEETFFGNFNIQDSFIVFKELSITPTTAYKVDWVTGHCLTVKGDFLRLIWDKYRLWERRLLFPIDLDDIDLMMMAKSLNLEVYVAPIVVPQNRDFNSQIESNNYNSARNDFHNYALSCVSFWQHWKYNPLLNWNKGYTGNANKPGKIHSKDIETKFLELVAMVKDVDPEIYEGFQKKLANE